MRTVLPNLGLFISTTLWPDGPFKYLSIPWPPAGVMVTPLLYVINSMSYNCSFMGQARNWLPVITNYLWISVFFLLTVFPCCAWPVWKFFSPNESSALPKNIVLQHMCGNILWYSTSLLWGSVNLFWINSFSSTMSHLSLLFIIKDYDLTYHAVILISCNKLFSLIHSPQLCYHSFSVDATKWSHSFIVINCDNLFSHPYGISSYTTVQHFHSHHLWSSCSLSLILVSCNLIVPLLHPHQLWFSWFPWFVIISCEPTVHLMYFHQLRSNCFLSSILISCHPPVP